MRKSELVPQAIGTPPAQLGLDREINDLRGLIEKLQGMARDGENLDPRFVALAKAGITTPVARGSSRSQIQAPLQPSGMNHPSGRPAAGLAAAAAGRIR